MLKGYITFWLANCAGTAIMPRLPLKYAPVNDFGFFATTSGVPTAVTVPPRIPAAGPYQLYNQIVA